MRRCSWLSIPVAVLVAAMLPGQRSPAAAATSAALPPPAALAQAIADAEALGVRTGFYACTSEGRRLHAHRAEEVFAPASNQKLLTAAVVLQGLGHDYRFRTPFVLRGGRLVVTASGDPNWITGSAHEPMAVFGAVARALQQRGVRALAEIELDAAGFRGPARPAAWPSDQLHTYYCAPTGPFVLDQAVFTLRIAGGAGAVAGVQLVGPTDAVALRGRIQLVDASKNAIYGGIDQGGAVQLSGSFPRKAPAVTVRTAVRDPADWYRAGLQQALASAGIRVGEPALQGGNAWPADGQVLVYETELAPALLRMLEESSNFDAEQCLRVLGQQSGDGSLSGGMQAMAALLQRLLGPLPVGMVLADGSGLSKTNRLSPLLLVRVLLASQQGPGGKVLRDALPVAGQTGTLAERFAGSPLAGRVRAKTGWIRGASSLSGCVECRDGQLRWFSILMNYDPNKNGLNKDLKLLQERMVAALERLEVAR